MPLRPRPARLPRPLLGGLAVVTAVTLAASLTACGDDGPDASERLADLGSAGIEQVYSAEYQLASGADAAQEAEVRVWRTSDRLRLEIETDGRTSTYLGGPDGHVSCQTPPSGKSTCLTVAGPDEEPDEAFVPSLRRVFGPTLEAFGALDDTLEIAAAGDEDVPVGTSVECFRVGGSASTKVDDGTYCLTVDGVPGKVSFPSGTVSLTALNFMPPGPEEFEPPAEPAPLPSKS